MLDFDWGNPLLSGEESTRDSDQMRQIFDQYNQTIAGNFRPLENNFSPQDPFQQNQTHLQSHYDSRAYNLSYPPPPPPPPPPPATITPESDAGYTDFYARIGLNLGGRTYFSSEEDFVNQLYGRSRTTVESSSSNTPRCQAQGCNADLTHSKSYHRRHKVCKFHSKAATVLIAGLTQRFCQQCSRFHLLPEFDQGKRSCRKRLADHNRRRRKSQSHHQLDNTTQSSPSQNPESN